MIYTNDVSVFIIHHHLNGLGKNNLRSIQEIMRIIKPAAKNYKKVCKNSPILRY